MTGYLARRLMVMVPLLLVISFMAFGLIRVAPGGPFDRERAPASPLVEEALKERYHLDKPLLEQFWIYIRGVARGDFGPSMKYRNHTVNDIIRQGLPVTLALGLSAFAFAMLIGLPLGVLAAAREGTFAGHAGNLVAISAICVPAFVLGPVLVMLFAVKLGWFPVAFWNSPWHAVLPVATLGFYFAGRVARLLREGMLTALQAEFITAARAKGLSERAILWKHAFPLAVLPVVSYSGPLLADLLTGSFVVENLFQIPGIGVFMVNSSLNRDYTMVVGLVLLYALLLLVLNLLVDVAYGFLDPRVRYD